MTSFVELTARHDVTPFWNVVDRSAALQSNTIQLPTAYLQLFLDCQTVETLRMTLQPYLIRPALRFHDEQSFLIFNSPTNTILFASASLTRSGLSKTRRSPKVVLSGALGPQGVEASSSGHRCCAEYVCVVVTRPELRMVSVSNFEMIETASAPVQSDEGRWGMDRLWGCGEG